MSAARKTYTWEITVWPVGESRGQLHIVRAVDEWGVRRQVRRAFPGCLSGEPRHLPMSERKPTIGRGAK